MKRISILLVILTLWAGPGLRAQDAATEERLNKLAGALEDAKARQETLSSQVNAQLQALSKEIDNLREQMSKPAPTYASQDDLKRLADAVKEIDRKRIKDNDEIRDQIRNLGKILAGAPPPPPPHRVHTPAADTTDKPEKTEKPEKPAKVSEDGYEYVIQKGDNLAIIVQAYKEKGIKVTQKQILDANPGLKPEKLYVGKKIFIPAPAAQ